jgi:glycosyltransferase involved in cell wall biosynthesis
MNPARIIILNDTSKALGGATALALLSARLISQAGYEVVYVTGDSGDAAELPSEVEVVALGGNPLLELPFAQRVEKGLYNRAAHALVEQVIEKFDGPDVVYHLHGWAQILSPSVLRALSIVESRLVIHAHDFFHACPNGTFFNFRQERVCDLQPMSLSCMTTNCDKRSASQKVFRLARMAVKQRLFHLSKTKAIVAIIHPFMSEWLQRAGISEHQTRVVRNPVKPFRTTRVAAERNSDLFFIGRVEPEKGVELAAEAAHQAGRRLRVIGDGSDRMRLAQKFPDVIWEGWCSHEQIAALISSARSLIMPSRLPEPFGLVALEALQSGVPLIAFSDSFVAREAATLGCAFLAADRRAGSLAKAIRMLDDDETVRRASHTAFERTGDLSCTHEGWCDELLGIYRELLCTASRTGPNNDAIFADAAKPSARQNAVSSG